MVPHGTIEVTSYPDGRSCLVSLDNISYACARRVVDLELELSECCKAYERMKSAYCMEIDLLSAERSRYANLVDSYSSEISLLQRSNALMEEELKRMRGIYDGLLSLNDRYREELVLLRHRGFWSRLFNR